MSRKALYPFLLSKHNCPKTPISIDGIFTIKVTGRKLARLVDVLCQPMLVRFSPCSKPDPKIGQAVAVMDGSMVACHMFHGRKESDVYDFQ